MRKNYNYRDPLAQDWENAERARYYRDALVKVMANTGRSGADGHTPDLDLANGLLDNIARIAGDVLQGTPQTPPAGTREAVKDVTCEACGFRYGAEHPMEDGTGYKCPLCEAAAAREEIPRLRDQLTEVGYLAYCIECAAKLVSTAALYRSDPR